MDIPHKREAIKKAYPNSKTWPYKVDGMSDNQVIAVYSRLCKKADQAIRRYKEFKPQKEG